MIYVDVINQGEVYYTIVLSEHYMNTRVSNWSLIGVLCAPEIQRLVGDMQDAEIFVKRRSNRYDGGHPKCTKLKKHDRIMIQLPDESLVVEIDDVWEKIERLHDGNLNADAYERHRNPIVIYRRGDYQITINVAEHPAIGRVFMIVFPESEGLEPMSLGKDLSVAMEAVEKNGILIGFS